MKEVDPNQSQTSILLLVGAFTLIAFKDLQPYARLSLGIAILCLAYAWLLNWWYSLREPIRKRRMDAEFKRITADYAKKISTFSDKISVPAAHNQGRVDVQAKYIELKQQGIPDKNIPSEIEKYIKSTGFTEDEDTKEANNMVLESFLKNMENEIRETRNKYINKPIDEKHSRPKFVLDKMATIRTQAFLVGFILLIIATVTQLAAK